MREESGIGFFIIGKTVRLQRSHGGYQLDSEDLPYGELRDKAISLFKEFEEYLNKRCEHK